MKKERREKLEKVDEWIRKGEKLFEDPSFSLLEENIRAIERRLWTHKKESKLWYKVMESLPKVQNNILNIHKDGDHQRYWVKKLQKHILFNEPYSVFYKTLLLSEKITDLLIRQYYHNNENEEAQRDKERLRRLIQGEQIQKAHKTKKQSGRYLTFTDKLNFLKNIAEDKEKDDLWVFYEYAKVINSARNKFMMHRINYDNYHFVFEKGNMGQKEELLSKDIFDNFMSDIKELKGKHGDKIPSSFILEYLARNFEEGREFFEKEENQTCRKTYVSQIEVIKGLSDKLCLLCFSFLAFLSKKNISF